MELALTIGIITGACVCLFVIFKPELKIGKIKAGTYWLVSLVGAIILLSCGVMPWEYVKNGLFSDAAVNPVKILVLFLSMTFISVFLDELGFFEYLAEKAIGGGGKTQRGLFVKLYALVSVLTVFTSNDIIVLTFTPFICCFAKNAKINPVPYLFAEFIAANTWSMCLIIGNPTNIYLATAANIDFWKYFAVMVLPTVFAGITSFLLLLLIFKRPLSESLCGEKSEKKKIDRPLVVIGAVHLAVTVILLAISSYIGLEMWVVSLSLALSLTAVSAIYSAVKKQGKKEILGAYKRLPYELVPFVLSMFVIVLALNYTGATEELAKVLSVGNPIWTVGSASFLAANVINNIPMSVLFSSVLSSPAFVGSGLGGVYAAIIGSNLGAFLTPVGALAGIMWLSLLKRSEVKISFGKFILIGGAVAIPSLIAALAGVCIVL